MPTRRQLANAIRALSMDAVQQANSGHPGMPMGMADIAEVLWARLPEAQPGEPDLAGSRPLRAVERPRLDAAVFAAAPDRLSARHRRPAELPPAGLAHRRASGARAGTSASRPPPVRSARASPMPSAWRSPRSCWPRQFNRPGHDDRRSPHLGVPRRRLPDGRHLARGLLARRHAEARQAHRASTTTTASRSTARCTAGSPTTRRSASRPMAGR